MSEENPQPSQQPTQQHTESHDLPVAPAYADFMRTGWGDRELDLPRHPVADHATRRRAALTDLLPDDVPVHVASQAAMDAIVGFPLHRGMLALGRRGEEPSAEALLARAGARVRVVVPFGIANHDNMGGIFRNAAAFGADAVLLDADCCDPLYRKAIRVSVGAALVVPFARLKRGEDVPALLDRYGFTALALTPSGTADLEDVAPPAKAAVLLGAEGPGLPADILARTRPVRIPMASGFDSLNVATASGIVLHYLAGG